MNHSVFQSCGGLPTRPGSGRASLPVVAGDLVAGKYLVGDVIAYGGMGVVVSATHQELRTQVATEIVRSDLASDDALVARFLNEARAAASLKSEHVARVMDCGKLDGGAPFLVMEYLEGMDLRGLFEERGPLPIEETVDYVLQVCEGLAEAHAAGIVHRDIKPENLFLTKSVCGRPVIKILDFGISKRITEQLGPRQVDDAWNEHRFALVHVTRANPGLEQGRRTHRSLVARSGAVRASDRQTPVRRRDGGGRFRSGTHARTAEPLHPSRMEIPASLGAVILRCLRQERRRAAFKASAPWLPHSARTPARTRHGSPRIPVPLAPWRIPNSQRARRRRLCRHRNAAAPELGMPARCRGNQVLAASDDQQHSGSAIAPATRRSRWRPPRSSRESIRNRQPPRLRAPRSSAGSSSSVSNTWTSMTIGAVDLWNDLRDVGVGRRPPLPPSVPAALPAPVVELPPETVAAPARPSTSRARARRASIAFAPRRR